VPDGAGNTEFERRLREVTVGEPERLTQRLRLADYDPAWGERYDREAARIRQALGTRARRLEHVGSTSRDHGACRLTSGARRDRQTRAMAFPQRLARGLPAGARRYWLLAPM
jgi:hypothetical protein